jgi:hypothetical protein
MQTAIGSPWNPLPGWRFPGPHDESIRRNNTTTNRGVFDAVGVPFAFTLDFSTDGNPYEGDFDEPGGILPRVLQPVGTSGVALNATRQSIRDLLGDADGDRLFFKWWNNQFATQRNASYTSGPFWSRSSQVHPLWSNGGWILQANANTPPEPLPPDPVPDPYEYPFGADLSRWSLYPNVDPELSANYPIWQSDDAQSDVAAFPGDLFRGRVFPFPGLVLIGRGNLNYGTRVVCRPVLV